MEAKIIKFLKENKQDYISGEDISRKLKVSRTAVWKHMQILKDAGYDIVALPHLGYRLISIPDRLFPDEILDGLETKFFGRKIFSYISTASTNDVAYKLAEDGISEGALVVSEKQTKGKGRLGRSWVSPEAGGLYFSLILRPKITPAEAGKITLMASVCVARLIKESFSLEAAIKWPNDVYIGREKVSGILTEMNAEPDAIKFLILGVGININTTAEKLPKGATSIKMKTGKNVSRIQFLQNLLSLMESNYKEIMKQNFSKTVDEWRNLSMTLGRRIKVKWRNSLLSGQAMDIDRYGALILRDDFGFSHHITSGDVSIIK